MEVRESFPLSFKSKLFPPSAAPKLTAPLTFLLTVQLLLTPLNFHKWTVSTTASTIHFLKPGLVFQCFKTHHPFSPGTRKGYIRSHPHTSTNASQYHTHFLPSNPTNWMCPYQGVSILTTNHPLPQVSCNLLDVRELNRHLRMGDCQTTGERPWKEHRAPTPSGSQPQSRALALQKHSARKANQPTQPTRTHQHKVVHGVLTTKMEFLAPGFQGAMGIRSLQLFRVQTDGRSCLSPDKTLPFQ